MILSYSLIVYLQIRRRVLYCQKPGKYTNNSKKKINKKLDDTSIILIKSNYFYNKHEFPRYN